MSVTPEIQAELQAAEELIVQYANYFGDLGFAYIGSHIEHSKVTADWAMFTFRNHSNDMHLRIAYFPPFRDMSRGFVVILTDHSDRKLRVNDYLRLHKREDLLEKFKDRKQSGEIAAFWAVFFETLKGLFSVELRGVVAGTEWEVVPFDWGNYK